MEFIDLKTQYNLLKESIDMRIQQVLDHGQYIMGPEVAELEAALAKFSDAKHVISCSSGTDALLMILMALSIKKGDAVFVPAFTFPATPEVVALLGAHPVFVDVNPDTYTMSPSSLEENIINARAQGLRPKVVMPVDLYGMPADYDELEQVCRHYDLKIVSDAAQSLGGIYKGRKVGTLGLATATSFFPAKPLGCYGDGGAVFTDDDTLAEVMRSIRVHGKGYNKYDNVRVGLNARLDTLQAAILLVKLSSFAGEIELRNKVAANYDKALSELVSTPAIMRDRISAWAQYTILLADEHERAHLQNQLRSRSIPTAIYYPEILPKQGAYAKYALPQQQFESSQWLAERVLSFPMHPYLTEKDIENITSEINVFRKEEVVV